MLDSDCHYFLQVGGSGDEDDLLMGFPGMWPPVDQQADTAEDHRRDEDAADMLNIAHERRSEGVFLWIDVVVATALLLFGLWR